MKFAMMTKLSLLAVVIFLSSLLWAADAPAGAAIDPQKSSITVSVFKAGVFSAFGHEHELSAPIEQGSFTENSASVELTVDARRMRVMDKGISEKDRTDIQQTMLGPKVTFSAYPASNLRGNPGSAVCKRAYNRCEPSTGIQQGSNRMKLRLLAITAALLAFSYAAPRSFSQDQGSSGAPDQNAPAA